MEITAKWPQEKSKTGSKKQNFSLTGGAKW